MRQRRPCACTTGSGRWEHHRAGQSAESGSASAPPAGGTRGEATSPVPCTPLLWLSAPRFRQPAKVWGGNSSSYSEAATTRSPSSRRRVTNERTRRTVVASSAPACSTSNFEDHPRKSPEVVAASWQGRRPPTPDRRRRHDRSSARQVRPRRCASAGLGHCCQRTARSTRSARCDPTRTEGNARCVHDLDR